MLLGRRKKEVPFVRNLLGMKLLWCLFLKKKWVSLVILVSLQTENPSKISSRVSGFPSSPERSRQGLFLQTGDLLGQRVTRTVPTQALKSCRRAAPAKARAGHSFDP